MTSVLETERRPVIVQKYGGSSLATAKHIHNVAARIQARKDDGVDVIVVVSAMGDSTDDLITLSDAVTNGQTPDAREMDTLLSTGELVSSTLMAMALKARGYDAISLSGIQAGIKTDMVHGFARIADINTDRLRRELDKGRIVIVAGFQGFAESGDITTLGRGGSDTTAVALAVAAEAERCEIYTDVDGIYTTDPRLTDKARKLSEIGFQEMLEMAVLGAKMNPRSIELGAVYDMRHHSRTNLELLSTEESTQWKSVRRLLESQSTETLARSPFEGLLIDPESQQGCCNRSQMRA